VERKKKEKTGKKNKKGGLRLGGGHLPEIKTQGSTWEAGTYFRSPGLVGEHEHQDTTGLFSPTGKKFPRTQKDPPGKTRRQKKRKEYLLQKQTTELIIKGIEEGMCLL